MTAKKRKAAKKQKKVSSKKLKKSTCEYEMKCLTKFRFCMCIGAAHQALNSLEATEDEIEIYSPNRNI